MASGRKGEYIVVSTLDQIEPGVIPRIPRHVTLLPWFTMETANLDNVSFRIEEIAAHYTQLAISGGEEAYFGPNEDILVRHVEQGKDELGRLHRELLRATRLVGANQTSKYIGSRYNPHVTKQPDGWIGRQETVTLRGLQLVQAVNNNPRGTREVLDTYDFTE